MRKPGIAGGENSTISLTVMAQYRSVTDEQTEWRTTTSHSI